MLRPVTVVMGLFFTSLAAGLIEAPQGVEFNHIVSIVYIGSANCIKET